MKVYIKNKFWSWGGGSDVLDENKQPLFKVKGKILSITRKKFLCDMEGNRLYIIRNKWFKFFVHKAFIYDKDKNKIATVKEKYFSMRANYTIEGYKDEIKVEGQFFKTGAIIYKNGEIMGTMRREITFINDAFELEANEEDIPFLIALIIAIDNITDRKFK